MFDQLTLDGVTVSAPDHRGQGSNSGQHTKLSLDDLADDVIALVRSLDAGPADLIGSSMGAYVAILAAAKAPELFSTAVLSAATGDAESRPEVFAKLEQRLRTEPASDLVDTITHTMFGDSFIASDSAGLGRWQKQFASLPATVADAAHEVFARDALWPAIDRLELPMLLLAGEQDHAKRPSDMFAIAERKPGSAVVVIAKSGHTPFVEQPASVSALINHWWQYAHDLHFPTERAREQL
ncbi:MAG: catD5 [Microbacteriaceae bacterium]|nr:catD5 [Microbacteriaceae bacterium]